MGTRGAIGVIIDGQIKASYNHSDSYPSYLGVRVLEDLKAIKRTRPKDWMVDKARSLRPVDQDDKPTEADKLTYSVFLNTQVGEGSDDSWYCLLRELQGRLEGTLNAGVILDYADFLEDSLFCEWAYLVDLDKGRLRVYEGFQETPHDAAPPGIDGTKNHVTDRTHCTYYPVREVASFPLSRLPSEKSFLKALKDEDADAA